MEIPKHTTQVGTVSAHKKMYLEDYCISYIRQLDKDYPGEKKQIALYGCLQKEKTVEYALVFGAALLGLGRSRTDSLSIAQREEAEKIRQVSFPDYKLVGVIVGTDTVSQNLYWLGYGSKAISQDGYFIFYDRNEAMLAFMMQRDQEEREPDVDPVIARKADMDLKKQEAAEEEARAKERAKAEKEKGGSYRQQMRLKAQKEGKNRRPQKPERGAVPQESRPKSRFPAAAAALLLAIGVVYGFRTYLPEGIAGRLPDFGAYITEVISQNSVLTAKEETDPDEQGESEDAAVGDQDGSGEASFDAAPLEITAIDAVEIPELETMAETLSPAEEGAAATDASDQTLAAAEQTQGTEAAAADGNSTTETAADGGSETETDADNSVTNETSDDTAQSSSPETYLIQKGDNLLTILRRHYGDDSMLQEVCEVNQIEDANNIQVGQTIVLP
ncbi:MAG: LysM peptidoglycan-binding domain-containing protein [Lachnospiraceae bacterium]|nr:LysM peptidoglycan-binding domain-containing protein [Lachnospiraceae bacterium]